MTSPAVAKAKRRPFCGHLLLTPAAAHRCRSMTAPNTPLTLFGAEERQHSPSVFQVAEAAGGRPVVDFCYLSNKFFPTPEILSRLAEVFEGIVRNNPPIQPEQCQLA